ncbi:MULTISPECIES: hypothetical protein [Bacillus]|uniref:hypothetical protein n=1 Tax=Bacillus TaxID=1386 RepID=UPI0011A16B45|nr:MULTISPECIES: hypothetical protein [Bacillus]MBU8657605.1 hypothetical protein [Bacillus pumilus]MBU8725330.1 hypothetical protein [Bacillus pumilus]MCM3035013.1 hypothetical protein [Bacillus pumilus]MCP1148061.1 hypothetical protein [Bacillus sp. 1735sda2]
MVYQNEKIQKKIALMNAKKKINQLANLEVIDFEDDSSQWMNLCEAVLKQFRQINSTPSDILTITDSESVMDWLKNSLDFLKEKKEWFILVVNDPFPVWANVKALDFDKAIEEIWLFSENHNVIVADKVTGKIAQIYSEEKHFELHIGRCQI